EDGIRDFHVTRVQTCALPIWVGHALRHHHRNVEEELFVFRNEREALGKHLFVRRRTSKGRSDLAQEYARTGYVSLMQLVPHGKEIGRASWREGAWLTGAAV